MERSSTSSGREGLGSAGLWLSAPSLCPLMFVFGLFFSLCFGFSGFFRGLCCGLMFFCCCFSSVLLDGLVNAHDRDVVPAHECAGGAQERRGGLYALPQTGGSKSRPYEGRFHGKKSPRPSLPRSLSPRRRGAGVQKRLKRLDSRLRGNDIKDRFSTLYEAIRFNEENGHVYLQRNHLHPGDAEK